MVVFGCVKSWNEIFSYVKPWIKILTWCVNNDFSLREIVKLTDYVTRENLIFYSLFVKKAAMENSEKQKCIFLFLFSIPFIFQSKAFPNLSNFSMAQGKSFLVSFIIYNIWKQFSDVEPHPNFFILLFTFFYLIFSLVV